MRMFASARHSSYCQPYFQPRFCKLSWFGGGWGRPKNPHSLERLKYLHNVLSKNTTVSESNRGVLVESLRCIAEILIWGDQNDSSVFDFFLEKNMLSYFLKIMRQKCGGSSFVCVQLLQTLNILFENIRNETSLCKLQHINVLNESLTLSLKTSQALINCN
ncbi:unnamed protein product [Leptidea sinapis]|uniref:FPL domain-containing protein n=1 Tax=Leptidea sinapis TaxID=189913 RepID=A0A5E4PUR1_9NEOP|nr:unnamed protein product [Leptidea sinapis]